MKLHSAPKILKNDRVKNGYTKFWQVVLISNNKEWQASALTWAGGLMARPTTYGNRFTLADVIGWPLCQPGQGCPPGKTFGFSLWLACSLPEEPNPPRPFPPGERGATSDSSNHWLLSYLALSFL